MALIIYNNFKFFCQYDRILNLFKISLRFYKVWRMGRNRLKRRKSALFSLTFFLRGFKILSDLNHPLLRIKLVRYVGETPNIRLI